MTARRAWVTLSVALVAAPMLVGILYVPTNGWCRVPEDPRPAQALLLGTPIVAFLVLAYLALAEPQLRWRIPELGACVLLIWPALAFGYYLVSFVGGCPGAVSMPWDTYAVRGYIWTGRMAPEPTPWPDGTALQITLMGGASPVGREYSTDAEVSLRTLPGARCTIDARYHGAKTPIPGLAPKTAASPIGWVYWGWTVSKTAPLGRASFTVACSLGNQTVTRSDGFDVWQSVSPAPNS